MGCVAAHLKGLAGCSPNALRRQRHQGRALVGHRHPQVDAVCAGDADVTRELEHLGDELAAPCVFGPRRRDGKDRRLVVEHLQQHRLQDSAAPSGTEQATVGDSRHHISRSTDRGEAQVGAVALGVAADVYRSLWKGRTHADQGAGGDVAGMVVLDDDCLRLGEFRSQCLHPPARRGDPGGIVGTWVQERRHRLLTQRLDDLGDNRPPVVEVDPDDLGAQFVEQVEQRREGRVFDQHSVAEPHDDLGNAIECIHRPVDHGQGLGTERPSGVQAGLEFGQHRVVEVAGGQ